MHRHDLVICGDRNTHNQVVEWWTHATLRSPAPHTSNDVTHAPSNPRPLRLFTGCWVRLYVPSHVPSPHPPRRPCNGRAPLTILVSVVCPGASGALGRNTLRYPHHMDSTSTRFRRQGDEPSAGACSKSTTEQSTASPQHVSLTSTEVWAWHRQQAATLALALHLALAPQDRKPVW